MKDEDVASFSIGVVIPDAVRQAGEKFCFDLTFLQLTIARFVAAIRRTGREDVGSDRKIFSIRRNNEPGDPGCQRAHFVGSPRCRDR